MEYLTTQTNRSKTMNHPDFAQLAEQEELTDPQANSDDLPELEECPVWAKIQKEVQITMAMEARIADLDEINGYLIRDGHDNSDIVESIAICEQVLIDIKA